MKACSFRTASQKIKDKIVFFCSLFTYVHIYFYRALISLFYFPFVHFLCFLLCTLFSFFFTLLLLFHSSLEKLLKKSLKTFDHHRGIRYFKHPCFFSKLLYTLFIYIISIGWCIFLHKIWNLPCSLHQLPCTLGSKPVLAKSSTTLSYLKKDYELKSAKLQS